jgi:hypothetical protein
MHTAAEVRPETDDRTTDDPERTAHTNRPSPEVQTAYLQVAATILMADSFM